jgi:CRISPR-associated protein Csm3
MHQRLSNSARLQLRIEPFGPLLIKSGIETPDPTRAGLEFVRTRHATLGETVYLPGTSLKGAFRSHAERSLRGLDIEICDPLDKKSFCRRGAVDEDTSRARVFAQQCAACRTFGSLKVAGRLNFADAMPWPPHASEDEQRQGLDRVNRTEPRFQVGISRETGAVQKGALYDLELVVEGAFYSELHLRNFELWQLALVMALVDDLNEGVFAIGFGKSRGLGRVKAALVGLDLELVGDGRELRGTAATVSGSEHRLYAGKAEDRIPLSPGLRERLQPSWRGHRLALDKAQEISQVAELLRPRLDAFLVESKKRTTHNARA